MNTPIASPSRFKRFPSISVAFLLLIKYPDKKQLKGEGVFFLPHGLDRVHHGEEAGHITSQQRNREQCQGHLPSTWDPFNEMVRPAFRWIFPLQLTYLRKSLRERPRTNLISYPESLPRWFQILPSWQLKAAITFSLSLQCHSSKDSPSTSHKHRDWAVLWYRVSSVL